MHTSFLSFWHSHFLPLIIPLRKNTLSQIATDVSGDFLAWHNFHLLIFIYCLIESLKRRSWIFKSLLHNGGDNDFAFIDCFVSTKILSNPMVGTKYDAGCILFNSSVRCKEADLGRRSQPSYPGERSHLYGGQRKENPLLGMSRSHFLLFHLTLNILTENKM